MGKITGFLEFERIENTYEPVESRVTHHKEFIAGLTTEEAQIQAARCMDCGTPFCHDACPVSNVIPDFNDLVYQDDWLGAIESLHSTNNFPEFTGRICPAPCEAACTLNLNSKPVGIKSLEHAIIERAYKEGWVKPQIAAAKTSKTVAVIGSGPAGLAAAQQLARKGHQVTVYEKNSQIGGLLRIGIPDFKLEKKYIDRRLDQLRAEGVVFVTNTLVGDLDEATGVMDLSLQQISSQEILEQFDAVLLAGGAERARDLPIPGRELKGVHFAMEYLGQQNLLNANINVVNQINAHGKQVIVIGGGDTGSDCVGTANRQQADSITQFTLYPALPEKENKLLTWPYWSKILRITSSHEEGCEQEFAVATKEFVGNNGQLIGIKTVAIEVVDDQAVEIPGTEQIWPCDIALLAIGFEGPVLSVLDSFNVDKSVCDKTRIKKAYITKNNKVFVAGDMRRGQSLVVWAIQEGRKVAQVIDKYLTEQTIKGSA